MKRLKSATPKRPAKQMPLAHSLKPVDQMRRRISPINLRASSNAAAPLGSMPSRSSAE